MAAGHPHHRAEGRENFYCDQTVMIDLLDIRLPQGKGPSGPKPTPIEHRFWPKVIVMQEGCWGWDASKHKHGYGKIGVGGHGMGWVCAHVVSWLIHFGPIPDGLWVLHKCDNPECCRPDHLFLGTPQDNSRDSVRKGRWVNSPEGVGVRKFSKQEILKIRLRIKGGESYTSIAKSIGVSEPTIRNIGKRVTYPEIV